LRRSLLVREYTDLADGELLESFVAQRDEAAFEVLVRRHGPMVLRVCRRILRTEADVEDAFQAIFLVLVQKAASIRPRALVANWLFGVARNTALKARAMNQRRQAKEREASSRRSPGPPLEDGPDWQPLLDQELQALPAKYRAAIVLCELEGKSLKEAAQQFGCPPATVGTWLARGRIRLHRRLTRRGVTLPAGALATLWGVDAASANVPASLLVATLKTASLLAAGRALAGLASTKVAGLTQAVLQTMFLAKLKLPLALAVVFFVLAGGAVSWTYRPAATDRQAEPTKAAIRTEPRPRPAVARAAEPIIQEIHLPPEGLRAGLPWSISPDATKLWHATARGQEILDLATNQTVPVLPPGDKVVCPVWSPHSDQVAYGHSKRGSEGSSIQVVPAAGGESRLIYASPDLRLQPSDWSRDGEWILATATGKDETTSMLLVPVAGGEPQPLFSVGWEDQNLSGSFSPDGQLIAYHLQGGEQPGYFLLELATRREIPLAAGPRPFFNRAPVWSPDGRYVLFHRARGEAWDLCAHRIEHHVPSGEPVVVKKDMDREKNSELRYPWMLDDGRLLYLTFDPPVRQLLAAAIDPDTGQLQGKPTVLSQRHEFPTNPGAVLSPDGQWLAGHRDQEMYLSKVDGTQTRKVPTSFGWPWPVGWFPDGKSVLAAGFRNDLKPASVLYRIDVATGQAEPLLGHPQAPLLIQGYPALSPDGQRIAFCDRGTEGAAAYGLYVQEAKPGTEPVLLRRDPTEYSRDPSWSPDGQALVFVAVRKTNDDKESLSRLLVIPAEGGEIQVLVGPTQGSLRNLGWSPSGKFIAYLHMPSSVAAQSEIWLARAAGGPPVHLRDLDPGGPYGSFCWFWSADGSSLLFPFPTAPPSARNRHHLWSMTNYLPPE
jgi:RNA polymerase sigma factor (sigma-70 family)